MSPFGSNFQDYVIFAELWRDNTVMLGDDTTWLHILGKGTISHWVETTPHAYKLLVLQDILHIKGIKHQFLSTNHFDQKGFSAKIGDGKVTIAKEKFSFSGFKTGHLYMCSLYTKKPLGAHSLNLVKTALPIKTWHNQLGHLNWEAIKAVQSDNPPLCGITLDSSPPPSTTCEGCAAGKAKCCTFKSSWNWTTRSTELIERIHTDLMGPMEVVSIGRAHYTCIFMCDHSSHVWTYFLKSKDILPQVQGQNTQNIQSIHHHDQEAHWPQDQVLPVQQR